MAGMFTRGGFPQQYDRTLLKEFGNSLAEYPTFYDKVFYETSAPAGKDYSLAEVSGIGTLREIADGGAAEFDTFVEGHKKTIYFKKFGLGVNFTEESVQDELFDQIKKAPKLLARSVSIKKEMIGWSVFAGMAGATALVPAATAWDGANVLANNHATLKGGKTINNLSTASLSTTALQAAFDYYATLVAQDGFPANVAANKLVCGRRSAWIANELQQSTGRVWDYHASYANMGVVNAGAVATPTANMAVPNMLRAENGAVQAWDLLLVPWIDADAGVFANNGSWFMLGDTPNPEQFLVYLWKKKPTMETWTDKPTKGTIADVSMRCAAACFDYTTIFGRVA